MNEEILIQIHEQILKPQFRNYEDRLLAITNSSKEKILAKEDMIKLLKLVDSVKYFKQVILLNQNMEEYFNNLMNTKLEIKNIYWTPVFKYNEDLNFHLLFKQLLEDFDEIIWVQKPWEIYKIDSSKFLRLINITWK